MNDKNGRPSLYNDILAREICEKIAKTRHGLVYLCKKYPHWPRRQTIYEWVLMHDSFAVMYTRAKCLQVDYLVDKSITRAFDSKDDIYIDKSGNAKPNVASIHRARLILDTVKWYASKLAPRIYGDRLQIETKNTDDQKEIEAAKIIAAKILDKSHE